MTIKKLKTVKAAPAPKADAAHHSGDRSAAASPGDMADGEVADMPTDAPAPKTGATIADRFKLDAPDPAALKKATASKKATQFALTAAVLALVVAGILTFTLYQHWDFLMPM